MKTFLTLMPILLLSISLQTSGQGDLLITQKRVVFEGNKQRQALDLVNIGKDTATYSISFVHYNQKEDGSYELIQKPDSNQMFAEPYLRIFPRKVTLAPGEPQIIMLQCRREPDMLAGEYRSHLYFRSEKNYSLLGTKNIDTTSVSVQLMPIFGITIPIIIRSGTVTATVVIDDLNLDIQQDTIALLKLSITRIGNISSYGQLKVEYFPSQGQPFQIGLLKNVAVFTCISKRNIIIKLNKTPGFSYTAGKIKVSYTSHDEEKYVVYADAELVLKDYQGKSKH